MPVRSSLKVSHTYDSLYYLAEFVVVSRNLASERDATPHFPLTTHIHTTYPTQKPPLQPLEVFQFGFREVIGLGASYTPV